MTSALIFGRVVDIDRPLRVEDAVLVIENPHPSDLFDNRQWRSHVAKHLGQTASVKRIDTADNTAFLRFQDGKGDWVPLESLQWIPT